MAAYVRGGTLTKRPWGIHSLALYEFLVSSVSSVHCELFPMETSSASILRKVCPQCSTTVHVRRAVCGCGYALYNADHVNFKSRNYHVVAYNISILAEGLHFSALVLEISPPSPPLFLLLLLPPPNGPCTTPITRCI